MNKLLVLLVLLYCLPFVAATYFPPGVNDIAVNNLYVMGNIYHNDTNFDIASLSSAQIATMFANYNSTSLVPTYCSNAVKNNSVANFTQLYSVGDVNATGSVYSGTNKLTSDSFKFCSSTSVGQLDCVLTLQAGDRVSIISKGSLNGTTTQTFVQLRLNNTVIDLTSYLVTTSSFRVPFTLLAYNASANAGTWNYSITSSAGTLNSTSTLIEIVR